MANDDHLKILTKGIKAWNQWRDENPDIRPNVTGASLSGAGLNGYNLRGARLRSVYLNVGNLNAADLSRADLRNAYLSGTNLTGANLNHADLSQTDLSGADLSGANLSEARLKGVNLKDARLVAVNLTGADLSQADLTGADFSRGDLTGADLSQAELEGADFSSADLGAANLKHSRMGHNIFANVDLSTMKDLETVQHIGPSTIGIDTIYRSKGNISEVFLRGAGVPEQFITYMRSLAANPIEFYSCFISYSTKDQQFADRLYADLQNKNVRCWFARHDMKSGLKVHQQIDQAIRVHEKLLLILSSHSMKSEWVKTEIAKARKREVRENKQVLFPVRLVSFETIRDWECFDADTGKDSAREIREFFIPDFSDWKDHDRYQETFERLLQDLKAGKSLAADSPS